MPQTRKYLVTLPPPSAPDVVKVALTVAEAGKDPLVLTPALTDTNVTIEVAAGAEVKLSLVDTNDDNLSSEPSELTFTADGPLPPPKPGELSVAPVVDPPAA